MKQTTPQTLVRAGRFYNSLDDAVKRCAEPLVNVPVGLGNTIKYAIFKGAKEPYLLMVSQQKDKLLSATGHNVLLTVTSYSDTRNRQVTDQFEKETGIDLSIEVPEQFKRQFMLMGLSFQVFERNPQGAMAVLRGQI